MIATAYVLGCLPDLSAVVNVEWRGIARKVFGPASVDAQLALIEETVAGWGYSPDTLRNLRSLAGRVMLAHGSPELARMTTPTLERLRHEAGMSHRSRGLVCCLSRVLAHLGVIDRPLPEQDVADARLAEARGVGMAVEWAEWVEQWETTSTLAAKTRATSRFWLLKIGRWLHGSHPDVTGPGQWTRQLAAEAVAAIDRMQRGEYTASHPGPLPAAGHALSPRSKAAALHALSIAFRDAQEWEWISRRFNPSRSFAIPRSIGALISPAPRVIADDVWAKLMWAGINLTGEDARSGSASTPTGRAPHYPLEFMRALALVWLFAGLRSDEIARLRAGCVRWQEPAADDGAGVCLLDVPAHKTGRPYTKPVDALVGTTIAAWETVRGRQPLLADRRTGELVSFLFCHRARRLPGQYLNDHLIPMLCRKAGVPLSDARGTITSHRARATIATQLYNAKDPMSLFELQAWLGHRSPAATQHYALITPNTLTKAYRDALALLQPRPRLLHVLFLRAVPTSDGLRSLRLLRPQSLDPRAAHRGQRGDGAHADDHPPDRAGEGGGRGRPGGARGAAPAPCRCPDTCRTHAPGARLHPSPRRARNGRERRGSDAGRGAGANRAEGVSSRS
jgi:integrase